MRKIYFLLCLLISVKAFSQFTPGNLVVYRVGDGSAALSSAATPVYLDEYTTSGTLVKSVALPTSVSGSNKRITASGTATSEGYISRSADGKYLMVTGYDAAVGTASITTSASATINRVVGRFDSQGNLDATTALTDFATGSNPRSVTSTNGTDLWVTGGAGGVRYTTLGSTTSTQVSTTLTNVRVVKTFSDQLYASTSSGSIRLGTVGTGLPTTTGQTITNLPGFPTSGGSPYDYFFADLDPTVPGVDVVYVADDGSTGSVGFLKYSLVNGAWVSNGNITVTGNSLRGITAVVSGTTVTLYGSSSTYLFKLVDATGYNSAITGTPAQLATAPTNTAFRGVAFAPISATATASLNVSVNSIPDFGSVVVGNNSSSQSYTLSGTNLTGAPGSISINAPSTDFQVSTDNTTWGASVLVPYSSATLTNTTVYVRFTPQSAGAKSGNIGISGGGASAITVSVSGTATAAPVPALTASALAAFNSTCINTTLGPNSFTLTGSNLTTADVTVGPLAGYSFSNSSTGTYASTLILTPSNGSLSQTVYVQFSPTAVQSYNGTIPVSGGGAAAISVAVSGSGINTAATVTTGAASGVTPTSADLAATITANGCGTPSAYGFEYSTTSGFSNGAGTQVTASNLASGTFSVSVTGLTSSTTYYYKAFVTTSAGTSFGTQQSFTTAQAPPAGAPVATAATNVSSTGFTANWNAVTGATGYSLDVYTVSGAGTQNIAGWNMATATASSLKADVGNVNNFNIQTLQPVGSVLAASSTYPTGPSGTSGTPNPYSVSASGWDNGANTKYWQVDVNTTGYDNLTLSSMQGSSGTGPKDFMVQYKIGTSGTWTDVPNGVVTMPGVTPSANNSSTWGVVSNLPLPSDANNQPLVSIRWLQTSNTPNVSTNTAISTSGTSRISAIYVRGTTIGGPTTTYVSGYQNLAVGNVTTYNVTGLNPSTTYNYVVRAENTSGTSANSNEITVSTTAAPSLTITTLNTFGSVCLNTVSSNGSFTINGTNLVSGDITVGPLAGYSFSTTATGTFTPSLTLTQTGGTYSQIVYVQFTPTAAQAYNGNIPVSGGGVSATVNLAATGTGVNTPPSVTTGASSAIALYSATVAGTISNAGCTAVTEYGIEYSTTSGLANGAGTKVPSTNQSSNSFSVDLSGLTPNTTYYYKTYATNAGGTTYGTELSFVTLSLNPTLSVGTIATFSNTCVNTASAPASFTITGANLTTANVTVGPLAGYTFSTTANGTYTNSLDLGQGGGTYSQVVYVKFTPTAVQTYSGDIPVSGGGVTTVINVAASGAGISTPPVVATGVASNITATGATVAGTISNNGCTAVSAYGIEYSTTSGFTNGTGTKVASTNLTGTGFTSALSGLTPGTTYYFKSYATNAGGTSYGTQQSFATLPPTITVSSLAGFGSTCLNTPVGPNSFTLTGANLTGANVTVGPLAGYSFATTANGTYSSSLTLAPSAGAISQTVYVKFTPTAAQSYNGNIPVTGGGMATAVNVAATATGVNTTPTVVTGSTTNITTNSAVLAGSITANGCSNVTTYGIEYSGVNNFDQGTGTKVESKNLSGNNFTIAATNLVQGATYYYRAYAANNGGVAYGPQQTFTVTAVPNTFVVYPNPINRGRELRFSTTNLNAGYHGVILYNSAGTKVFEKGFNVQVNFINDKITVPYALTPGVYWVQLVNNTSVISTKTILVF